MIARGISESESGASKMEATLKAVDDSDEELLRQKEASRRRREEAEQARQKEREKAKLQRQKEWEERNRQFQEEMERNEQEELQAREMKQAMDSQCQRELAAASRIQARFRGRRSRDGHPINSPVVKPLLHGQPWQRP